MCHVVFPLVKMWTFPVHVFIHAKRQTSHGYWFWRGLSNKQMCCRFPQAIPVTQWLATTAQESIICESSASSWWMTLCLSARLSRLPWGPVLPASLCWVSPTWTHTHNPNNTSVVANHLHSLRCKATHGGFAGITGFSHSHVFSMLVWWQNGIDATELALIVLNVCDTWSFTRTSVAQAVFCRCLAQSRDQHAGVLKERKQEK